MHPVLFKIGSFELHSWGVAAVISFLLGISVALRRAPRFKVKPDTIMDLAVIVMISAIVGSRIWYVVYHLDEFRGHWFDTINPFQHGQIGIAGLSMVGGVVLAIIASVAYTRIKKLSFLRIADAVAPSFLLGAGIQRLGGCFLNGCCFGRPTNSFLGMVFPAEGVAGTYFPGVHIWPTQLFASALGFAGFALIIWLGRRHSFPGYTFWQVFAYYSLDRIFVDQFRYYEPHQILWTPGPLTINVNDIVLAMLFIICIVFWFRGWSKSKKSKPAC
ncbi:prolipoprotein diacylglyceryl transferase [candidate division WOR-3 bacterium JGI_Cruoil_03_51_56]|uniref:Phosphatidylglycerol--prolipoprotein diacylglyceryl transferase n=1 Tax=candidate division WOR-3 bacterium JGI_Cruoil_03_51_56 TaxID=1973747 RepID=A0A235BPP0_UNCW3|nr:MAG: prolipoprotein diacylglyceryl transferase [candidate division WOR-3 bacterium JGI_Cruoil_03_51_56]